MNSARARLKSLKDLKILMDTDALPVSTQPHSNPSGHNTSTSDPKKDQKFFLNAMANVTPLPPNNTINRQMERSDLQPKKNRIQNETLKLLKDLVRNGTGFVVSDTPEYIEGTGYHIPHPDIIPRLHGGEFSIQAHIDLHGFIVSEARIKFDNFLKSSLSSGKRAVLIIHGRGLSSPNHPVLKNHVIKWLNQKTWRKWIIAFSSARLCDGGAGATYVLLRNQPALRHQK